MPAIVIYLIVNAIIVGIAANAVGREELLHKQKADWQLERRMWDESLKPLTPVEGLPDYVPARKKGEVER